ncbi:MAG: helix-turn-helix transcriptional regulator [Clostridia bacterium]|nr:helix-turn-helix transcriptional regulator [Clostridia bacterium]
MDQIKIGKFIADKRKEQNMTQLQVAEKLGITDRAVSKWETGKSMPDSAIMLELCDLLKITVNELLCGEKLSMENYNKELEKNLLETLKEKEDSDKRLLANEIVMGVIAVISLITLACIATYIDMELWLRILLAAIGIAVMLGASIFALRIEQKAGYYECAKCGYRYVPAYKNVFLAMHVNRTRFMKCPHCGKRSWQRKVVSKNR